MSEQMRREIIVHPGEEFVIRGAGGTVSDPLSEVLDAIVAEGHVDIRLERLPTWPWADVWQCRTNLAAKWEGGSVEQHIEWRFVNHDGEARAATALEAAQKRLDQIRLGKSLTWLAFAAPEAE